MSIDIQSVSSSVAAITEQYEVITGNIANASSAGYKRRLSVFSQALDAQMKTQAAGAAAGTSAAQAGSITEQTAIDFGQGSMQQTGNPFDMGLDGEGFFVVETPQGELYTRHGQFALNAQGQLVDGSGRLVAGEGGPITVPPTVGHGSVSVSRDGSVFANGQSIGKLKTVAFADPQKLIPAGKQCFRAPAGVLPESASSCRVQQGYQEMSNVSVVEELVGLITVTRLYEANIKNLQVQDEMMKNLLGVASR